MGLEGCEVADLHVLVLSWIRDTVEADLCLTTDFVSLIYWGCCGYQQEQQQQTCDESMAEVVVATTGLVSWTIHCVVYLV